MEGRRQPSLAAWWTGRAPRRCCSCMQPGQLPWEHAHQLGHAQLVCLRHLVVHGIRPAGVPSPSTS